MAHEYDVVVIGSGVAGALVAWKLAAAHCNVVLLDAGEKRLEPSDRAQFVKAFTEANNKGKTPSQPYMNDMNNTFAVSPDTGDFKVKSEPTPY